MASLNPIPFELNLIPERDEMAFSFAQMMVDHDLFDLSGYGLDEDTHEKCCKVAKIAYMLADAMNAERNASHAS